MQHDENCPIDKDFIEKYKASEEIQNFLRLRNKKDKNNTGKVRVRSVPTPTGQFTELPEIRTKEIEAINVNKLLDCSNSGLAKFEKAVLELQFLYGLRISEVLNIQPSDINSNGNILIHGLKGSENRSVYPVRFLDFWLFMRDNNVQIPKSYNRQYFFRLYVL